MHFPQRLYAIFLFPPFFCFPYTRNSGNRFGKFGTFTQAMIFQRFKVPNLMPIIHSLLNLVIRQIRHFHGFLA